MFNTLGTATPASRVPREESYSLAFSFEGPDAYKFKHGTPVKITTDGSVAVLTGGELSIGIVVTGTPSVYKEVDRPVIQTIFSAEVIGIADGTVTPADRLTSTGVDANGVPKFKKAVAGDYICAIAIGSAASLTTTDVRVGILRSPLIEPAAAA